MHSSRPLDQQKGQRATEPWDENVLMTIVDSNMEEVGLLHIDHYKKFIWRSQTHISLGFTK